MKIPKISLFCIICLWIELGMCKFYMTSFEIGKLLKSEREVLKSLNGFVTRQEKRGITFDPSVKNFLEDAELANNASLDNPLSVFHHIHRFVEEWKEFAKTVSCDETREECPILTGEDVINVVKRREKAEWPTEADLKFAAQTIVNVWLVYDLDLEELVSGNYGNVSERPLTGDQIFFVANTARDARMTYAAITWFEYLLNRLDNFDVTFKQSSLYRRLAMTYFEFGMMSKARETLTQLSIIDPDDKGMSRDLEFLDSRSYQDDKKTEFVRFGANDTSKNTQSLLHYEKLCRSTAEGELHYNWNLTCMLVPIKKWYGNVKVELISKYPRIEIIHDVLYNDESDEFISYANKFLLSPARVPAQQMLISKAMCENHRKSPLTKKLTRRLFRLTGFEMYQRFKVASSQCYEMISEGPGIISQPVTDFWKAGNYPHPYAGNRLASIYMQLSDVQYGGALVFPRINVTVSLPKGSAVVWWNLRRDGNPSLRSTYQHCPVLQGSKWGLFKRVLNNNQMFARNCDK